MDQDPTIHAALTVLGRARGGARPAVFVGPEVESPILPPPRHLFLARFRFCESAQIMRRRRRRDRREHQPLDRMRTSLSAR
jgi:hypothetical protein